MDDVEDEGGEKIIANGADVRRRVGGKNLPQIAQIDVDGRLSRCFEGCIDHGYPPMAERSRSRSSIASRRLRRLKWMGG